jgi:hypothetical protein
MDKNVIHNNENSIANYRTVNYMNTTLFIQRTIHSNLGFPHGLCSHYKSTKSPFGAISQSDCLRKCSKKYFEKYLYCSPLIINGIISELDGDLNQTNHCSKEMNGIFYKLIRNKNLLDYCKSFCPKDCIFIDYKLINTFVDEKDIRSSHNLYYSSVEPK